MTDIKNSDFFRLGHGTSPDPLVRCFPRSHVEWNQPSRTPTRDGWKVIPAAVRLSQPLAAYGSRQKLSGNHQTRVSIAIRITVWPKAKLWQGDAVDDGGKVLEQICTIVTTSIYKNVGVPLAPLRTPVRKSARTFGAYVAAVSAWLSSSCEMLLASKFEEQRRPKQLLIFEKTIMHFPKPVVRSRDFGAFRRLFCIKMHLRQRKMTKGKA
jgi:hypothetical protein